MDINQRNNIHIIGKPDAAATLIFGHGFGLDQTTFRQVIPAFENNYKIVLYDNVGGGKSDIAAFSFNRYATTEGYVKDLADIVHGLDLKNVTYIGHSVSGMIGLMTSLQYQGIFDKLIMIGSSPRYENDPVNGYVGGFDKTALSDLYESMETNYYAWTSGFSMAVMNQPERPDLAQDFARSLQQIRADIAVSVARSIFQMDIRRLLPQVKIPVLILETAEDIAVPSVVSQYMEANIPGSKRYKVNTTGHFPHISAPGEVIAGIKTFL
ncbi:alpha/beta fold hydrolase [Chitinophaga sp. Cy-1792]|uniref:alpha/beta fold hydrolase n=1 Tax=Chitinophaga sp. Cy-1792 TaxID=2608339 RepID=UPI00142160E9|nr:alpha/beta hydrolase [Chitinophaga sp. Cy-1792]NIG54225.1 alpha/beta hydrolase [Chitinophaga sp. Cy-1792]